MKKYTVYLLTPYCIYEDVEAKTQKEAISKIDLPKELDYAEVFKIIAMENEQSEELFWRTPKIK